MENAPPTTAAVTTWAVLASTNSSQAGWTPAPKGAYEAESPHRAATQALFALAVVGSAISFVYTSVLYVAASSRLRH